MHPSTVKRTYTILGWIWIIVGIFNLFIVLTGRSWNCPQPVGLNISRILGGSGQVISGIGILFQAKTIKLSLFLIILGTMAIIIAMYLLFTTPHNDCSPSSNPAQQFTPVRYIPL